MSSTDRNAPCHCGSGKKYKKCCAWKDSAARTAEHGPAAAARSARNTPAEEDFTAEMKPDLDKEVDHLLERLERGEHQAVRARIATLYEKYPRYHATNFAMGVYVAMIEKDSVRAVPFFEKAVQIFPMFAEAYYNLGAALLGACRIGPAVAAFRNAIRYSTDGDGIEERARARLSSLEKTITGTSSFSTLDAYIKHEELFNVAFENLREKRYREAVEIFGQVLDQDSTHVQSHGNLALALAGLGRKADPLRSLDRALELDSTYQPALLNRRAIETMTEGEPFVPGMFAETEYYLECVGGKRSRSGLRRFFHQFFHRDR